MKHHEPGRPYPHKKPGQGHPPVNHYDAAHHNRRREIRRNRIIFGVGVAVVLLLLIWGIAALVGRGSKADSAPAESAAPSSASQSQAVSESQAASESTPAVLPESEAASESQPEPESAPASEEAAVPAESVPESESVAEPTPTPEPSFVPTWNTTGIEGFPYLLAVNRVTQTVTVYAKDAEGNYTVPHSSMICSTGTDTPVGEFRTTDQYTWRALVGGVYGQYATRITGSILFHSVPYFAQDKGRLESEEFNKLGTPASLGCVRLQIKDCKWIYDECPSGTPVVLYDGDASTDPLGNPGFEPIDLSSPNAGWDPSDPDPANPWHAA